MGRKSKRARVFIRKNNLLGEQIDPALAKRLGITNRLKTATTETDTTPTETKKEIGRAHV